MKETFYKKVGRRYVPVSEYDIDLFNSMSKGSHLVMCYPGGRSIRYNVNPNHAALIAASRVAEDAMTHALFRASEMRPKHRPYTEKQKQAWLNLQRAFGDDMYALNSESARGIAEAGIRALQEEADKLLTNSAVRLAYDHFLMVAELTKKEKA